MLFDTFREGLQALGYVEGENLELVVKWAEGDESRHPELAAELMAEEVHVIVAPTTPSVLAAKNATSHIPVIMVAVADPVGTGLVPELRRPGGNVSGLTMLSTELSGKRIEQGRELVPDLGHIGVMWNPVNPAKAAEVAEIGETGQTMGVRVRSLPVRDPDGLEPGFDDAAMAGVQALIVLGDPLMTTQRAALADLARRHRLPTIFETGEYAEAGGLLTYGPNRADLFRRAASYVDKVLRGQWVGGLPVEQPTRFDLTLNLSAARAIELDIPARMVLQADRVIE